ncbi:MAG: protein-export chaperone SecB [Steroidobacteraceae bacterium]
MSEQNLPNGEAAAPGAPGIALQNVYIKDVSFEAPQGPFVPAQSQDPKVGLNLGSATNSLGGDVHEVVLTVTLEAKTGEIPVYLVEVKQAGVFVVRGYSADDTRRILGAFAPNVLFPYARQVVSDMITKGGFPPFFLPPVNFDAIFEHSLQEQAARGAAAQPTQIN